MIDTGRNWLAPGVIKHLIAGMAMLKMNVLHWHLTDDQSFPISTSAFPELSKHTTFAPTAHYNLPDLKEIVSFAAVIMELLTECYECSIHQLAVAHLFGQLLPTFIGVSVSCIRQERGIRVLPEIETPGHGSCRAKVVPQLNLSSCPGVLNPTLNATYDFLLTLLSEIAPVFPEPTL